MFTSNRYVAQNNYHVKYLHEMNSTNSSEINAVLKKRILFMETLQRSSGRTICMSSICIKNIVYVFTTVMFLVKNNMAKRLQRINKSAVDN